MIVFAAQRRKKKRGREEKFWLDAGKIFPLPDGEKY